MAEADTRKPMSGRRQFSVFLLVGGVAALVNWMSRIAFSAAGLTLGAAVVCAYVIGMATAYVLSRRFVFERSGHAMHREMDRFVIVNIVAVAQVWIVTISLDYWLPALGWTWHPALLAHAVGVASPTATSYFGHRYFTFRKARGESVAAPVGGAVAEPSSSQ